ICKLPAQHALGGSRWIGLRGRRKSNGRRGRCDWPIVRAGENRQTTVGLNPDRHFGANEVKALGAQPAQQKASTGKADLGFWSTRNDGAVGVPHDDVTQAQRSAAALVALELSASDDHGMIAAEVLFNGGL